MAKTLVCTLALAVSLPAIFGGCTSTAKPASQQSFTDKLTSSVKSGTSKMMAAVKPKKSYSQVPLDPPTGKPGPNVFIAAAQMHEGAGNYAEAEANYRKALDMDPDHAGALVGYARLEDRQGNFAAATKFYERAIKKHPKDASVHNDLGLCYHRHGQLPNAIRELKRAVDLEKDSKLYRNNLAAAYVEQGNKKEALDQLIAAHGKGVGHYNLAYLLEQKKDHEGALEHFRLAYEADSNLVAAQEWIVRLSAPGTYASYAGGAQLPPNAAQQPANAAYVAQRPMVQQGQPAQYAPQSAPAYGVPPQPHSDPLPPMPR